MVATMVEQVSNVPLVSSSLGDYYVNIFKVIEPQVRAHFAPTQLKPPTTDEVEIFARLMLSFTSSAGISAKQNAAQANFEWLPKVWSLVIRYKKAGLFGVFAACYLTICRITNKDEATLHLPTALAYLHERGKVPDMLELAGKILDYPSYVIGKRNLVFGISISTKGNFTELVTALIAAHDLKFPK